nr:immunoglobulin light chain junction region [Macaca mulatta]MOV74224.1 immunoglobulin light chain junction region [Macaca mulatta]MOV74374.1 immunoglobulin light chain junction region [Macaca mulatta]MOV74409.1 immunoglobulin light chain junction region [Macaca mulatta]MOV74444.1 immunoglobulin light chain junction region [Macaca mulatta]
CQQESNWPLTF